MTIFVISNKYTTFATRAIIVHTALSDDSFIRCDNFNELDESFDFVPVGSVEYVLAYMQHKNIIQPALPCYPTIVDLPFDPYKRKIKLKTSEEVLKNFDRISNSFFIKPTKVKQFNGFVLNRNITDEHDLEQYKTLQSLLNDKESFWVSEIVEFQSEVRFYISNKKIIGVGRYDDGPNKVELPDVNVVEAIIDKLWYHPYALDVGVLKTGETVIVEVTDAWAIGYYSDSYFCPELPMTPAKYAKFLSDRWKSILGGQHA